MRILVTGSSGLIGQHLVRHLANGHEVYGLDLLDADIPAKRRIICDICDRDALGKAFGEVQPEAVVHLAARTDFFADKLSDYAANIGGVRNLVSVVAQTPSVRRAIYTSTQLVCRIGYRPEHETDYCPPNFYGESKVLTERAVREGHSAGPQIIWCIARPTTVWGPGMNAHYQRFFGMVKKGLYFHVGAKKLYKSYSYVGNIVHQYERLLMAPADKIQTKVFYLADYEPLSLQDWVDGLQRAFGARRIPTVPMPVAKLIARGGDLLEQLGWKNVPFNSFRLNNILTEYTFDLTPTKEVCGPLPYQLEQGIEQTAQWFESTR